MEKTLDLSRWNEKPLGITYRRWVIASNGLRQLYRTKFFRLLILIGWSLGFALAAAGFLFGQSIAPEGLLAQLASHLGPRAEAVVSAFSSYVLLYPDVVVEGVFTVLFRAHADIALLLSLAALTAIVPSLVAQDRAGSALTVYLSRPLTSSDYLIGKFGIIVGVMVILWTGPLLFAWFVSILFAADLTFISYSIGPLLRALLINLIAMGVLGPIALGISSLAKTTAATIVIWMAAWIGIGHIAAMPFMPTFIRHVSFTFNLELVERAVFRLDRYAETAQEMVPFFNLDHAATLLANNVRPENVPSALIGLGFLVATSCLIFLRRLKSE